MHPPGARTVLVRYGEIGVKSDQVQDRMEGRLRDNIQAAVDQHGMEGQVRRGQTRLYVDTTTDEIESVTDAVTDVFGVVSASPTVRTDPALDAIGEALAAAARRRYDSGTFAVRARRAGPASAHPFASTDIETEGGAAIWESLEERGGDPAVDLDDPDLTFFVECRPDEAFVFLEKRAGPGGLPLGSQQPLVALVSGGIDSPVAAWLAMKRGAPVYPLYVDLGEYGGVDHRLRTERTVAKLKEYAPNRDLHLRIAHGGPGIDMIVESADTCRILVLRRFMFRIATHVAEAVDAGGIVTGESIGQKSSQTSSNLRVTSEVTPLPVLRPLLAMDKTEITERAREIGTYPESTIPAGCNRIAPDQPATRPALSVVRDAEPSDIQTLAADAAEEVDTMTVEKLAADPDFTA